MSEEGNIVRVQPCEIPVGTVLPHAVDKQISITKQVKESEGLESKPFPANVILYFD